MKKFISMALALCMSMALTVPAMAVEVDTAGNGGEVPVVVESENALTFSVTLPTSMPVYVDANGDVTTASNLVITNNSAGAVDVKDVSIAGAGTWAVENYDEDFTQYAVNSEHFAIQLQGAYKSTNTTDIDFTYAAGTGSFQNAADESFMRAGVGDGADTANNFIDLSYDAKVSMQADPFTETVANVTYTVGWYTGE